MNMRMSSYSTVKRKIPRQVRGERRVAKLLGAAEAIIADVGYEAATMSAIAERANASIGSLYQFFPNKACITQALRTEYAKQFDAIYASLARHARKLSQEALVAHLIELTVHFVDTHPALPALLDAPHSTRTPAAMRRILRERFSGFLLAQHPRMAKGKALTLATVTLHIIKALNQLYVELPPPQRPAFVREFKAVLFSYWTARLPSGADGRARK